MRKPLLGSKGNQKDPETTKKAPLASRSGDCVWKGKAYHTHGGHNSIAQLARGTHTTHHSPTTHSPTEQQKGNTGTATTTTTKSATTISNTFIQTHTYTHTHVHRRCTHTHTHTFASRTAVFPFTLEACCVFCLREG